MSTIQIIILVLVTNTMTLYFTRRFYEELLDDIISLEDLDND